MKIARRRPVAEQASWFSIYWGWWFTGADFATQRERAQTILSDLKEVEDAEVRLQVRHCNWAIDFNLGRHEYCIAGVDEGLALYGAGRGRENVTLFGEHDARACGLGHKGLSLWLTGHPAKAVRAVSEARQWAQLTEHIGSIAHTYDIEAMLHYYRRDFDALRGVVSDMRRLNEKAGRPSLAAKIRIFGGWCEGVTGDGELGLAMIRQGLAVHGEIETSEDYPVFCDMLAELMAQTGEIDSGLELLSAAAAEADAAGHRYWLAQLHHRRARLLMQQGAAIADVNAALAASLDIADEQNAVPFLLAAYDTLVSSGLSDDLVSRYRSRIEAARSSVEMEDAKVREGA